MKATGRWMSGVAAVAVFALPAVSWAQAKAVEKVEKKAAPAAKAMEGVMVTYETDKTAEELAGPYTDFAKFLKKGMPGLVMKAWINDGKTFGGFYIFADKASAEAYINSDLIQNTLVKNPANRNVQIKYYEVNSNLCAITGCPHKTLSGK